MEPTTLERGQETPCGPHAPLPRDPKANRMGPKGASPAGSGPWLSSREKLPKILLFIYSTSEK